MGVAPKQKTYAHFLLLLIPLSPFTGNGVPFFYFEKTRLEGSSLPTEFWAHLHEQKEGLGQFLVIHETQGTRSHWWRIFFSVLPHGWRICFLGLQDKHLSPQVKREWLLGSQSARMMSWVSSPAPPDGSNSNSFIFVWGYFRPTPTVLRDHSWPSCCVRWEMNPMGCWGTDHGWQCTRQVPERLCAMC